MKIETEIKIINEIVIIVFSQQIFLLPQQQKIQNKGRFLTPGSGSPI